MSEFIEQGRAYVTRDLEHREVVIVYGEICDSDNLRVPVCEITIRDSKLPYAMTASLSRDQMVWVGIRDRRCRVCGCTSFDCEPCINKTGARCHWVEDDLCSACANE